MKRIATLAAVAIALAGSLLTGPLTPAHAVPNKLYPCGFDYNICREDWSTFSRAGVEVTPIQYTAPNATCPGGCTVYGYWFRYAG